MEIGKTILITNTKISMKMRMLKQFHDLSDGKNHIFYRSSTL